MLYTTVYKEVYKTVYKAVDETIYNTDVQTFNRRDVTEQPSQCNSRHLIMNMAANCLHRINGDTLCGSDLRGSRAKFDVTDDELPAWLEMIGEVDRYTVSLQGRVARAAVWTDLA